NVGPVNSGVTTVNRVPGQPLFLKDLNCHCIDPNKDFVLNPNAWAQPAAGQYGTAAPFYNDYRYGRTPSEQAGIGRIFTIKEGFTHPTRPNFFTVFNRVYLNQPVSINALQTPSRVNGNATGGFGYISPGNVLFPQRNGQLVARFQF